jgi:hypothetical protein
MSSEIIQHVAYENYDDFQHVNFMVGTVKEGNSFFFKEVM